MSKIQIRIKLLLIVWFHGTSTTGFVIPRRRSPGFAALQNAYLDALDSIPGERGGTSTVFSGDTVQIPKQSTPVETEPPVEPISTTATSPIIPPPPQAEPNTPPPVVEVMPMDTPKTDTNGTNGAFGANGSVGNGANGANTVNKSSYEAQRQKYENNFQDNSQPNFFETNGFNTDTNKRGKDDLAPVVEVLPKDHPYQEDGSRMDHLAVKNLELEQANSRLEQENERQRFELESFLRNSLSDPLYPRLPMEGDPSFGDPFVENELIEDNSRLQSENERQRQDLEAFQQELSSMENVIQSIEDKSIVETGKLTEDNRMLRDENDRQRGQLEDLKAEFEKMQTVIQTMRDESMALENEKRLLQNEKNLLETRLKGADNDNERNTFEIQTFQKQMIEMENMLQSLKDEKTILVNEKEALQKERESLDSRLIGTTDDFQRQHLELDAYKKDRSSMETLVQSIRDESAALQNEKTKLESNVIEMNKNLQNLSQQLANSQDQYNRLNSEKDKYVFESNEAYRQLQLRFQEALNEMKTLKNEKMSMEKRIENAEAINEKQSFEIESYRRERGNMENMIEALQKESMALKEEKTTMESTILNMQQTLQNLEQQLTSSTDELTRLRNENQSLLTQNTKTYETYNELQIQFEQVMADLQACQDARAGPGGMPMGGVEDFRNRINNRRQNQMKRNQVEDGDGWWN